jgi:Nif-specific regulatory protein
MYSPGKTDGKYLDFVNQVGRLLNSGGDLMRNMNTVLIVLQEYLPVRNPCLLIRDNVINKYFIDLAPEISEDEKNRWNRRIAALPGAPNLRLNHEAVLYPDDPDYFQLPGTKLLKKSGAVNIIQPVIYQQQNLPLAILSLMVGTTEQLNEICRIARFMGDMLAVSMIARGFPLARIEEAVREHVDVPRVIDDIVGQSEELKRLADIIRKVSASKATVLICGESGTGKELLARAIHNHSLHRKAPFISVNCAALSESLLESELFGHEKGAFTGAASTRKGRFELADGGTLFLDEIGDTTVRFQTKILRVLQEGQFERLGGTRTLHVDVRVVCATNTHLEEAIRQGAFREDLYYRLNVIRLDVPPLRERCEDIPLLVGFFLNHLNQQSNSEVCIRPEDMERLANQDWPGNIRELENAIHSAFLMQKDNHLVFQERKPIKALKPPPPTNSQEATAVRTSGTCHPLEREEIEMIEQALARCGGIQVKAAAQLGISLRQLRYRIRKYRIVVRKMQGFQ